MISDALLREAAAEAEVCLLANLPEIQPHEFSAGFERKMKRLISRVNHPIRHQVLRYAAAVLLAILTLFGAVIAVSPEARAAVVGWVKSTFYEFVEYSNSGTTTPGANDYHLTYIPDGYALLDVVDTISEKTYVYADASGRVLRFSYSIGGNSSSLFVDAERYQHSIAFVHGIEADVYLAESDDGANVIVWSDAEADVIFRVHAIIDRDELVKISESVRKE